MTHSSNDTLLKSKPYSKKTLMTSVDFDISLEIEWVDAIKIGLSKIFNVERKVSSTS